MEQNLSADLARANNEPLYGTIKSANVWFLLEYNGIYTRNAWEDARIPNDLRTKLDNYPDSRPLLIRQPNQLKEIDRIITFFVVDAASESPRIFHFEFATYDAILDLDIDAVLAGDIIEPHREPLYVICTNGKRDMCCSKYGVALYNAMVEREHQNVWQSSHIGGHRFAGTMLCFPHALCYGHLTEDDAASVSESYRHKRILLEKLRGHAIYDKPIQAAEYFLRRELDNDAIDGLKYISHAEGNESWSVIFAVGNVRYQVHLASATALQVIATTGDNFYKTIPQFRFVDYRKI